MDDVYQIAQISSVATYAVRHPMLRAGKPVESCAFQGDDLATTIHFGLFINEELAAVLSAFSAQSPLFANKHQTQFRGMAVLSEHQGKGFGFALLHHAETYFKTKKQGLIWFNAREAAVPFYLKANYLSIGEAFNIGDIGLHYVMYKTLA
jgi:GNAT superfamily N-acetyltransferase